MHSRVNDEGLEGPSISGDVPLEHLTKKGESERAEFRGYYNSHQEMLLCTDDRRINRYFCLKMIRLSEDSFNWRDAVHQQGAFMGFQGRQAS